jgi:diguanylate cyclase (GGDEF)-like protein
MIFTLISLTAALIVFGFIQAFFLRPLTKVGEYLQHLRLNPNQQISDTSAPILLKECQELKGQLGEYHNALLASQNQLKKSNQQLEHISLSDPTTKIGNQRALDQYWQTSLEMQSLSPKPVAYLMLSCENFRGMVYQYGFQITEELVKQWVARLKEHNSSTPLFRISPDTLVMILVDFDPQRLEQQAHTIIEQLGTKYSEIGIQQPVLFRLGISYVDRKKDSLAMKRLPKQADFALYRAMHSETSRVYIFSEPL